ncbi:MAG: hypothetical protein ABIO46_02010 [Chitinophagales bacterium]
MAEIVEKDNYGKYGEKSQDKIEKTMHERKHGELNRASYKNIMSGKQANEWPMRTGRADNV